MNNTLQIVAKRLITNRIYNAYSDWQSLPIYIQKITNYYFETMTNVNINYKSIKEKEENGGYIFLKNLLLNTESDDDDDDNNDLITFISIDIFKLLFPNLKEMTIDFTDCLKNEYIINGRLFSYMALFLKSINWHQIMIILPDNYDEDKLFSTINSFKYQFEQFNWTLKRESYQHRITFLNNNKLKSSVLSEKETLFLTLVFLD